MRIQLLKDGTIQIYGDMGDMTNFRDMVALAVENPGVLVEAQVMNENGVQPIHVQVLDEV